MSSAIREKSLHQRKTTVTPSREAGLLVDHDEEEDEEHARRTKFATYQNASLIKPGAKEDDGQVSTKDYLVMLGIMAVAGFLRFYRIEHPPGVVFDEVHFGKFASAYIRREFFFDVHPPLAKLMLAGAGWLIGYDGHFDFDNIGDDYIVNEVPYIGLRTLPAILGTLIPVVLYAIMREIGSPAIIGLLTASFIIFDNAHVCQTRLILLDAPLLLFQALAIYSYIRFYKQRYNEFSQAWWGWMLSTGVFLALTISCKMVGLFLFMMIGAAVAWDLWNILDIRRGHSMDHVMRHFLARAFGLIVVPAVVYLFWFWVHFAVLTRSGTGDEFMSPTFQETLQGSPLTMAAEDIRYFDTVTLVHKQTKVMLHSHPETYPLKYDDGRISSNGQQVTGYPFNDTNNHWIVEPTKEIPDSGRGRVVRHHDVIQLRHVNTDSFLLTHDVASPLMPTNTEFTTWPASDIGTRYNETLFQLDIQDAHEGQQWTTKSGHFKLIQITLQVALWSHKEPPLPDWAFKQQEINGNKNKLDQTNIWVADEIIRDENATDFVRPPPPQPKEIKKLNFFRKFFELQVLMLQHNAGLTDSHPYASGPVNWPFLLSGISFWTGVGDSKEQVYMIGNVVSWWLCVIGLSVFFGVLGADQLAARRGLAPIPEATRNRMYNTTGFFLFGWFTHYLPFYTMNRQLFLHHYLPAHLLSALVTGCVYNFIATETVNYPISIAGPTTRRRPRQYAEITWLMRSGVAIAILAMIAVFIFEAPLTYGRPGLDPAAVNRRRILDSWTLHWAK